MSVEVVFETSEEVCARLALYEQLFQHRYTERDEGYRQALQNAHRVHQVPVISPWPPRGSQYSRRGRYDDWDGGGRRRGGYRGRWRDHRPYHHHHHHNPRYHDDRPPWGYGGRSPRDDYRDRSPFRDHSPFSSPSRHYRHRNSSSPPPHPHLSPPPHHHSSRSRSRSPLSRCHASSPRRPAREDDPSRERAPPTPPPPLLPLPLLLSEEDERVVPTKSDVLDILSVAHAAQSHVTPSSLRRREGARGRGAREGRGRGGKDMPQSGVAVRGRREGGEGEGERGEDAGVSKVVVSHGKTEIISSSLLVGTTAVGDTLEGGRGGGGRTGRGGKEIIHKKMKKPKIVISESEEEEEDDERDEGEGEDGERRGVPAKESNSDINITDVPRGKERGGGRRGEENRGGRGREGGRGGRGGTCTRGEDEEQGRLVMRLDKRFCSVNSPRVDFCGSGEANVPVDCPGSHYIPRTPTAAATPTFLGTAMVTGTGPPSMAQPVEKEEEGKLQGSQGPQGEGGGGSVEKKKKKKKKHKHSSVEGGPHELQPFRLKINLGQPPDCS